MALVNIVRKKNDIFKRFIINKRVLRNVGTRNFLSSNFTYEMKLNLASEFLIYDTSFITSYTGDGSVNIVGLGYNEINYG
jgi:hypothetical protein